MMTSNEPVNWVIIVMDYVSTDLRNLIAGAKQFNLNENHVAVILFNMLTAVKFFHSTGMMHRDIKPANFLVD